MSATRRSYLWNYFTTLSEREKIALCVACRQSFSYRSTVTNMRKHLERLHPELLGLPKSKPVPEPGTEMTDWGEAEKKLKRGRPARSKLWQYFKRVLPRHARCEACAQLMAYHGSTTSNLRKHLERKHADLLRQLTQEERQTSPIAQETVIEGYYSAVHEEATETEHQNDEIGQPMEEVYLDDEDIFKTDSTSTQTEKPKIKDHKKKHKRRKSIYYSSDEEPIKPKVKNIEESPDETIDIFGKYITSLLKKLPQNVANRLQIEFVTRIINAKMEIDKANNQDTQMNTDQIMTHNTPELLHQNSNLLSLNTPPLSQDGVLQTGAIIAQDAIGGPDQPKYLITVTTQEGTYSNMVE